MFGLFKKSVSAPDLEFLFLLAAIDAVETGAPTSRLCELIEKLLNCTLEEGRLKLSEYQWGGVRAAASRVAIDSRLRDLLKNCRGEGGDLSPLAVQNVADVLRKGGCTFG